MLKGARVGQGMEDAKGKAQLEDGVKDNKKSFHKCDSSKNR